VLATVSASHSRHLAGTGESAAAALTGGYHLAFLIAAGLVVAAIAVALLVLEPEPEPRAAAQAELPAAPPELVAAQVCSDVA
jgi:hypothetical protein